MIGPRGVDLSDVRFDCPSLAAGASGSEDGASFVESIMDVMGGAVLDGVFVITLDDVLSLEGAPIDETVDGLIDRVADDDAVVVAETEGGVA
jgi:hypothetical protein